jgi:distribution and morphology protein 31
MDQLNYGAKGPFSWIKSGTVDIDARFHAAAGSPDQLKMDFDLRINDMVASVPLQNEDLSYLSSALIKPVVTYMNARRNPPPIACSIELPFNQMNGAWTVYQCSIPELLSTEVGKSVARMVSDHRRQDYVFKIGLWTLQDWSKRMFALWEHSRGVRTWNEWHGFPNFDH